jgi:hypothetical protein
VVLAATAEIAGGMDMAAIGIAGPEGTGATVTVAIATIAALAVKDEATEAIADPAATVKAAKADARKARRLTSRRRSSQEERRSNPPRHPRESGDPDFCLLLGSRLRGNDEEKEKALPLRRRLFIFIRGHCQTLRRRYKHGCRIGRHGGSPTLGAIPTIGRPVSVAPERAFLIRSGAFGQPFCSSMAMTAVAWDERGEPRGNEK